MTYGISMNEMSKGSQRAHLRCLELQGSFAENYPRLQYKWHAERLAKSTFEMSGIIGLFCEKETYGISINGFPTGSQRAHSIDLACHTPVAKSRCSHLDVVDFGEVTCDLQGPCREVCGVVPRKV